MNALVTSRTARDKQERKQRRAARQQKQKRIQKKVESEIAVFERSIGLRFDEPPALDSDSAASSDDEETYYSFTRPQPPFSTAEDRSGRQLLKREVEARQVLKAKQQAFLNLTKREQFDLLKSTARAQPIPTKSIRKKKLIESANQPEIPQLDGLDEEPDIQVIHDSLDSIFPRELIEPRRARMTAPSRLSAASRAGAGSALSFIQHETRRTSALWDTVTEATTEGEGEQADSPITMMRQMTAEHGSRGPVSVLAPVDGDDTLPTAAELDAFTPDISSDPRLNPLVVSAHHDTMRNTHVPARFVFDDELDENAYDMVATPRAPPPPIRKAPKKVKKTFTKQEGIFFPRESADQRSDWRYDHSSKFSIIPFTRKFFSEETKLDFGQAHTARKLAEYQTRKIQRVRDNRTRLRSIRAFKKAVERKEPYAVKQYLALTRSPPKERPRQELPLTDRGDIDESYLELPDLEDDSESS